MTKEKSDTALGKVGNGSSVEAGIESSDNSLHSGDEEFQRCDGDLRRSISRFNRFVIAAVILVALIGTGVALDKQEVVMALALASLAAILFLLLLVQGCDAEGEQ